MVILMDTCNVQTQGLQAISTRVLFYYWQCVRGVSVVAVVNVWPSISFGDTGDRFCLGDCFDLVQVVGTLDGYILRSSVGCEYNIP